MNLYGWRPGQQPRPRIQTIAQRTPAVAPQKKSWRSQAQFFHQLDRPSATRTKRSTQNTEENLKTSIAASPSLTRAWRLRRSSTDSREPESDSFLACATKKKGGWRRARDDARRRFHRLPRYLSAGCSVRCCFFSDLMKLSRTIRGFPVELKAFSHEIESTLSRFIKKSRFESIRFKTRSSLIRALAWIVSLTTIPSHITEYPAIRHRKTRAPWPVSLLNKRFRTTV